MAKSSLFNVNNKAGELLNTTVIPGNRSELIMIDDLQVNELNDYPITEIEALAEEIRTFGLINPLNVKPTNGAGKKYTIISGERRYTAIKLLLSEGDTSFEKGIPCWIDTKIEDELEERIKLILANTQREMSDEFKRKKTIELYDLYQAWANKTGKKINIGKLVAQNLGISDRQVMRYKKIEKELIPELKNELDNSNITLVQALELTSLPTEEQEAAANLITGDISIKSVGMESFKEIVKNESKKKNNSVDDVHTEEKDNDVKSNSDNTEVKENKALENLYSDTKKTLSKIMVRASDYKAKYTKTQKGLESFLKELNSMIKVIEQTLEKTDECEE